MTLHQQVTTVLLLLYISYPECLLTVEEHEEASQDEEVRSKHATPPSNEASKLTHDTAPTGSHYTLQGQYCTI